MLFAFPLSNQHFCPNRKTSSEDKANLSLCIDSPRYNPVVLVAIAIRYFLVEAQQESKYHQDSEKKVLSKRLPWWRSERQLWLVKVLLC